MRCGRRTACARLARERRGSGAGSGEGGARDGGCGGGATLSEATVDLTKAAGSSAAPAIMRTEAARRGCDSGTRDLMASEEAEATERSSARATAMRSRAPLARKSPSHGRYFQRTTF